MDIALSKESNLNSIIELKSMYSWDILGFSNSDLRQSITQDFIKNTKCILNDDVNFFEIIIATHPDNLVNQKYHEVIKYHNGFKKVADKNSKLDTGQCFEKCNIII